MLEPSATSRALGPPTQVCARVMPTAGTACPRTPGLKRVPAAAVFTVTSCAAAIDARDGEEKTARHSNTFDRSRISLRSHKQLLDVARRVREQYRSTSVLLKDGRGICRSRR